MNIYENTNFASKYPVAVQQYEKAKKRLAEGDADDTLTAARKSLEFFVSDFCKNCGLETTGETKGVGVSIESMINSLKEHQILNEQEISVLHAVRRLGNVGSHSIATMDEAREAVELLEKAVEIFMERDNEGAFQQAAEEVNVPKVDPDYYAPTRRYRGAWSECYTREELAVLPDYIALQRKADDEHDITAMLNLAVGFLHKHPVWSANQIVCMPKYYSRGREYYQEDAYDTRYYYWIMRACYQAIINKDSGISYPKKYMATAFVEAMKFALSLRAGERYNYYVAGIQQGNYPGEDQLIYKDQYQMVEELYGVNFQNELVYDQSFRWARETINLMKEVNSSRVVAELHKENTPEAVRYLGYCFACMHLYCDMPMQERDILGIQDCELDIDMALAPEDIGGAVSIERLQQRTPAYLQNTGYTQAVVALCSEAKKEADLKKNHPKMAAARDTGSAVGNKIKELASRSTFVHHLVTELHWAPYMPILIILSLVFEKMPKVFLLLPAMLIVVACMFLQGKLLQYSSSIPVPEESNSMYRMSDNWLKLIEVIILVVIAGFMLVIMKKYTGIIAKAIMLLSLIASVFCHPGLQNVLKNLYRMLMGKKMQ